MKFVKRAIACLLLTLVPGVGYADQVHMLLETRNDFEADDEKPLEEVYLATSSNMADFTSDIFSAVGYLPLDIGKQYSIRAFAYAFGGYQMILESRSNKDGGEELYLMSYDSLADVRSNTPSYIGYLPTDIDGAYSLAGLTVADGTLQLFLQPNEDVDGYKRLYLVNYDSLDALKSSTVSSEYELGATIGIGYSSRGVTFDGTRYHMLIERLVDKESDEEPDLYLASFLGLDGLRNDVLESGQFLPINIGRNYEVAGFSIDPSVQGPPSGVPEPGSWMMLVAGVGAVGGAMRARRSGLVHRPQAC